ncbi:hypothetical protein EMCRGX_G000198 [Ephydatia muelleri]
MHCSGGWALLGSRNDIEWSLNGEQFLQEKLLGSPAFFSMSVGPDPNGGSKLCLTVVKSGLTLPSPESYLKQDALSNLTKQIVCQLQKLNPDGMLSDYEDAASKIAAVEYALAEISRSDRSGTSSITLKQLGSLWKDYSWVENTAALFRSAGVNDITENEIVSVNGIQYFSNLSTTIGTFSNLTLQNYAKWQLLNSKSQWFAAVTKGLPSSSNDILCLAIVKELMPIALGRFFAEYILPTDTKTTAAQMMVNIMRAFRTRIGSLKWLDQQTIAQAQNKIDLMIAMIAYPDLTFNDTLLNKFYSELTVSADDFASNLYYYLGFEVKTNLSQLRQPANLWTMVPAQFDPLEVQASYYPSLNQIYILQGIMRPPSFHPSWPQYFQYGFLGGILGHEITHGFDNDGRLYNGTGQKQNMWTQSSINNFTLREQCYVDQYSSLSLFGIHDDESLTLGENIADNGGLISSYTAYVQKGENDICDDGKEIAEAEDWESTVKENRSSLHPCLIHPISLHNFSTVISSPSVNNTLDSYQRVWGPSIGTILLRHRLQEQGEPSLPVFIRQRVSENRIGIALQAVHPDYHRIRLNGASRILNPQPYRAAYFGEKLHNEKLVMFGVTHICAIDGYSGKIVQFVSMPVKNPVQIYQHLFR